MSGGFWDVFVSQWKALSILCTGVFGVIGLLFDFKDKETGSVTLAGQISLAGIIVSAVFGVIAQFAENNINDDKAADAARKSALMINSINEIVKGVGSSLQNIERSINIIDNNSSFSIVLSIDCESIDCDNLRKKYISGLHKEFFQGWAVDGIIQAGLSWTKCVDLKNDIVCDFAATNLHTTSAIGISDLKDAEINLFVHKDRYVKPIYMHVNAKSGQSAVFANQGKSEDYDADNRTFKMVADNRLQGLPKKSSNEAVKRFH